MKTFASVAVLSLMLAGPVLAADDSAKMDESATNVEAEKSSDASADSGAAASRNGAGASVEQNAAASGGSSSGAGQTSSSDMKTTADTEMKAKTSAGPSADTSMGQGDSQMRAGSDMEARTSQSTADGSKSSLGSSSGSASMATAGSANWQNDKDLVRRVQSQLKQSGYEVGPVDGIYGPRTRQALVDFQKDKGMQASGQIDQNLLAEMKIDGSLGAQQAATPGTDPVGSTQQRPALRDDANEGMFTDQPGEARGDNR